MMGKKSSVEVRAEIERLSREGKTQREIAARASLCIDTVRTIQRALGLRRPRAAMRTRGPLSLQEKKEIARLYKKGWLITSIGKRMRLTRGTVARHIKRMALAPPGLPEEKPERFVSGPSLARPTAPAARTTSRAPPGPAARVGG